MEKTISNKTSLRIVLLIAFIAIILFSVLIIIIRTSDNENIQLTTFKKSYSVVTDNSSPQESLEVLIYISDKDTAFTKESTFKSTALCDKTQNNYLSMSLEKITDMKYSQQIKKNKFHMFSYIFSISFDTNDLFEFDLEEAYLELKNLDNTYLIGIGSFYYYKVPYYGAKHNLSISQLKPIVNKISMNNSLVGIILEINNQTLEQVTIKNIKVLKSGINVSNKDIKKTTNDYNSNVLISDILGYSYNYHDTNDVTNIIYEDEINPNQKQKYIIPLKYHNDYLINSLGLVIEYEIKNKEGCFYLDEFTFFQDNLIMAQEKDIEIYTYDRI